MSVASEMAEGGSGRRGVDRLAGGFVLIVLALGCLGVWVGIPTGMLWALSKLTDSKVTHFLAAIVAIPALILLVLPLLVWLNDLYLRVTGATDEEDEDDDQEGLYGFRRRGPLEPMLIGCLVVALIALFVWFFGFARNPSQQVI